MKHPLAITLSLTLLAVAAPQGASAACYADYKAKQDNPLKLHYGVAELTGACAKKEAKAELTPRLARDGWTLLNILSVFGDDGLQERKESAGTYFLRF